MSDRSTGWAGILCVVAVAVALFLPGPRLPSAIDSAAAVSSFIAGHRLQWMLGAWLTFPELAFFLWFCVGLRQHILRSARDANGLPQYMMIGAAATVGAGLIATTLQIVIGVVPSQTLGNAGVVALYAAWLASGVPVLFMPLAVMQFGGVEAMRRYSGVPSWLTAIGFAGVAASVVGTVTTFYASGPFALNGPVGYVAFALFALWVVLMSLRLIGR